MITYKHSTNISSYDTNISVFLDNKHVGVIKNVSGGYQYFPKGKKNGGDVFTSVKDVKDSLN